MGFGLARLHPLHYTHMLLNTWNGVIKSNAQIYLVRGQGYILMFVKGNMRQEASVCGMKLYNGRFLGEGGMRAYLEVGRLVGADRLQDHGEERLRRRLGERSGRLSGGLGVGI